MFSGMALAKGPTKSQNVNYSRKIFMQRRDFLKCCSAGSLGLYPALSLAAQVNGAEVLPPRRTHFEPKARNLIFVFLTGGMSHVDTFDYKLRLRTDHGRLLP